MGQQRKQLQLDEILREVYIPFIYLHALGDTGWFHNTTFMHLE
jgi:hypothetical protein